LPPAGAAAVRVTVAVVLVPPVTLLGLNVIEFTATPGVTVRLPCAVLFPRLAVMVTVWLLLVNPLPAVASKLAVVAPAGTVTVVGTWTNPGLLEDRVTMEPPEGAAALKVTVPVDVAPSGMLVGLKVTDETLGPQPDPVLGVSSKRVP
jgi:hypothetical protein